MFASSGWGCWGFKTVQRTQLKRSCQDISEALKIEGVVDVVTAADPAVSRCPHLGFDFLVICYFWAILKGPLGILFFFFLAGLVKHIMQINVVEVDCI